MIKILQLSDLHIVKDSDGNNLKSLILRTAREKFAPLKKEEKLLIITGDFHFFNESDYEKSLEFIKELVGAMGLEMKEDVFLIPGNHDVSLSRDKFERINQGNLVKAVKSDIRLLQDDDYIDLLLCRFKEYSAFCQKLGVYTQEQFPASVHIRTWRGRLNILHLNTCLVADATEKQNQLLDTKKVTDIRFTNDLPRIVIGHNSFFDLHSEVQTSLSAVFDRENVGAYLCGDRHRIENDRYQQDILLMSGYGDKRMIPNIVCCRSSADVKDDYSDVGCLIHEWEPSSGKVSLVILRWEAIIDQSKFEEKRIPNVYNLSNAPRNDDSFVHQVTSQSIIIPSQVLRDYQKYLRLRCSEIETNGLPTNTEDIPRTYELSKLFVPPRLFNRNSIEPEYYALLESPYIRYLSDHLLFYPFEDVELKDLIPENEPFHFLILGTPGAGKTTLLKKIALTYCYPNEYLSESGLTNRELFPIWIRCRDINDQSSSIWNAINNIPVLAEWTPEVNSSGVFSMLVNHHIEKGTALLLIDGLDEIGSDRGRVSFVEQLNSFVGRYPSVNIIITSREKGFSILTNDLFKDFTPFTIAPLNNLEITEICQKWFSLVYGDTNDVKEDCQKLTKRIISDLRLTRLATNPLMLTTLLLVDRRTGSLPTKRAGLYFEATKVLLENWNSAYHETAIDLEEAKNQLAYVAFQMTSHFAQYKNRITRQELVYLLREVRADYSNLVSGNVGTVDNVISVIERRSALMIQTGTEKMSDGHLEPVYEFQHPTFQEYLAAFAVSINCFPCAKSFPTKGSVLANYIDDSNMKEVILLSATINSEIASYLVKTIGQMLQDAKTDDEQTKLREFLLQFVADEASLSREEIHNIFLICRGNGIPKSFIQIFEQIVRGKFRQNLQDFFDQFDEEHYNGYDWYSSLVHLLAKDISDPKQFYLDYRHNSDDKQRVRALSVLFSAIFAGKVKLSIDERIDIKRNTLAVIKDNNSYVALAGFELLRFCEDMNEETEFSDYFDAFFRYINLFNRVPNPIAITDIKASGRIKINSALTDKSFKLLVETVSSNPVLSYEEYKEKLTLAFAASLSCENYETLLNMYNALIKIVPLRKKKEAIHCHAHLVKLINSCTFASNTAKVAAEGFSNKYEISYWTEMGRTFVPKDKTAYLINELENEVVRILITPFSIGRATESDYLIDKPRVSRKHAQIKLVDNYYLLEDLQSMNGTFVDGNLVKVGIGYRLKNGSIIQIEDNFFTFHVNPEYEESYETPH